MFVFYMGVCSLMYLLLVIYTQSCLVIAKNNADVTKAVQTHLPPIANLKVRGSSPDEAKSFRSF